MLEATPVRPIEVWATDWARVGTMSMRPVPSIMTTTKPMTSPMVSARWMSVAITSLTAMVKPAMAAVRSGTKAKPRASLTQASKRAAAGLKRVEAMASGATIIRTAIISLAAQMTMIEIVAIRAATMKRARLARAPEK